MKDAALPRWPLLPIAAPAFVAIWSGWVGLGEKTGFGVINPLPGTPWAGWQLDTRITLPIGVEAYAAYALWVWLGSRRAPDRARAFAKWSAAGALLLGALGQIAFHLMEVAGIGEAPTWITTLVSSLPVVVVGLATALHHLAVTAEGEEPAAQVHLEPIVVIDRKGVGDFAAFAPVAETYDQAEADLRAAQEVVDRARPEPSKPAPGRPDVSDLLLVGQAVWKKLPADGRTYKAFEAQFKADKHKAGTARLKELFRTVRDQQSIAA